MLDFRGETLHSSERHKNAEQKLERLFTPRGNGNAHNEFQGDEEAMSHKEVMYEILLELIPRLVVHEMDWNYPKKYGVYWYMDRHWHRRRHTSKYDKDRTHWCKCCWARVSMDPEKSCQFCRQGWIMSQVSRDWRDMVHMFGLAQARWWWKWPAAHRANKNGRMEIRPDR